MERDVPVVQALAVHPEGRHLAIGDALGTVVRLLDQDVTGPPDMVETVAFRADGRYLAGAEVPTTATSRGRR